MKCKFIFGSFVFIALRITLFSQIGTLEPTLEIKVIDGNSVAYQNNIPLPSFEMQNRKTLNLAGTWRKERTTADDNITLAKRDSAGYANLISEAEERFLKEYDDSGWEEKDLPSVENQMKVYPKVPEFFYDGVWYRRTFEVDESDSGKFAKLVFLAANYIADVWINGEYVGYHEGGYTPFAFDISSFLKFGQINSIAVRIDLIAWGLRKDIIPHKPVDWFNYGGIIHDVYIEFANTISVTRADIVPLNLDGEIKTKILLQNTHNLPADVDIAIKVFEANIDTENISSEFTYNLIGEEVNPSGIINNSLSVLPNSVRVWETNVQITNPKIWSPKEPNLYIMQVVLSQNGNVIDEYSTQFGIRTVQTIGNKFLLNDKVMFLTGAARHEDHPVYGRSLPKDVIFNDLQIVKSLNINFLRTAHYPNHPYTYLILDRLGITVMEEIPLWQVDTEEPWNIQNNIRKMHLQMFREMVYKDYNRPSIIMWSTSNECHEETNRLVYNQMVIDDFTQNYDDGRLISQSPAADKPGPTDVTQELVDVAGWTMYFGIFHGSTYFGGTYNFINKVKLSYPEKPILDTEFGYWSSENNSSIDKQVTVAEETFNAFKLHAALNSDGSLKANGSLMGCTWWCVFDWYSSFHPNGFQSMGLYSMDRQTAKPVAATIKSLYYPYYVNDGVLTSVNDNLLSSDLVNDYQLKQNYPNPFNPSTIIEYSLPEQSQIKISLFSILGEEVAVLVNSIVEKGNHKISVNADELNADKISLSSGIYFCRMYAKTKDRGDIQKSIKILLIK